MSALIFYHFTSVFVAGVIINFRFAESRKLEVRCGLKKQDQTNKIYVHMLNGTLCATERALCCLVENYQTPEVRFDLAFPGSNKMILTYPPRSHRVYESRKYSSRTWVARTSYRSRRSYRNTCNGRNKLSLLSFVSPSIVIPFLINRFIRLTYVLFNGMRTAKSVF